MDSLIKKLLEELTRRANRISIIEDADGFLARPDTMKALQEQAQDERNDRETGMV